MRILLAQNAPYYPAHGGGDKSNRLLMEALAARGHECRVVARLAAFGEREEQVYMNELARRGIGARAECGVVSFERASVPVRVVANANPRSYFTAEAQAFRPDAILTSTDDPAQLLLEAALRVEGARVVYLARATLALPFGPDCAFPSEASTVRIRQVSAVVGVSQYVADYVRRHSGIEAVHVPIAPMEAGPWPDLGNPANDFVTMVNPCAVKGIDIFLALADAFPEVAFAAVPMWGTNARDRAELAARPNIALLDPVDRIDLLLARTRVLLVPSVWAEARSRMVVEAMLRGVPVMASAVGGIPEAKMGVPYVLPVAPIEHYQARLDERMVPVAEVPRQEMGPWAEAIERLLHDEAHYREIARASRAAALDYAAHLSVEPFERLLEEAVARPRPTAARTAGHAARPAGQTRSAAESLSPEKRRLLAIRLRQRAPAAAWFPGAEAVAGPRLFCFPHAGGGASAFAGWRNAQIPACPVRLPGRESRLAEAPFERMGPLVEALAHALESYLAQPYAFFGHSMGAAVAFELARALARRGLPGPAALFVSGARAPRCRRGWVPPAAPSDDELLEELRRLEGTPAELLEDPLAMRAMLPALRADAALYRNYVYADGAPLVCPIHAYGGEGDGRLAGGHLEAWAQETTGRFTVRWFPGGHFFPYARGEEFLRELAADLALHW
jgi:surfactin synthase thioesterase subunit/glycosyltransferase involved in cell wall biosynthesis